MVIHELKHPIDSVIGYLKYYKAEVLQQQQTINKQF